MIEFKRGDILEDDAEALVNTVNCVGVMGRGIALAVQESLPRELQGLRGRLSARARCSRGGCSCSRPGSSTNPRYIINFPTKRHWRGKSRMEDIEAGLEALVEEIRTPRHPLHRDPAARQRAGRAGLDATCGRGSSGAGGARRTCEVIVFEPSEAPDCDAMVASSARCRR